jgi:hypothetical protein
MSPKLLATFLLLSSGVLYYFVITPLYKGGGDLWNPAVSIVSGRQQVKEDTLALARAGDIVAQANELRDDFKKISDEDKQKIKIMLPDSIDRTRLLSEMVNMTNTIGVTIKDVSVSEAAQPAPGAPGTFIISFSLTTSYPRFKELIRKFETNMRLFRLVSVSFTPNEKEPESIAFAVSFSTFYMK